MTRYIIDQFLLASSLFGDDENLSVFNLDSYRRSRLTSLLLVL